MSKHYSALAALLLIGPLAGSPLLGQASLSNTTSFVPSDPSRTSLDIGGSWNSAMGVEITSGVNGDRFTLAVTNDATGDPMTDTAFDVAVRVTLPAGFSYIPNSVSGDVAGEPTIAGNDLLFALPASQDIAPGATLTINYGLVTSTSVVAGTYALDYLVDYSTSEGGALDQSFDPPDQNVLVEAGASVLTITPSNQLRAVGDSALFEVSVTNTGLGGLFDVVIDETAISALAGASLSLVSVTQTAPAVASVESPSDVFTLPHLSSGESFVVDVVATVADCLDIENTAATNDRTGLTAANLSAQVTLDLTQPLIDYSPPSPSLLYSSSISYSMSVDNMGMGDASNVQLTTNLPLLGVDVTPVGGDWTYSVVGGTQGVFTLAANGGVLANMDSITLEFTLQPTDICNTSAGGTLIWGTNYLNGCGDSYATPTHLANIGSPTDAPSVDVSKVVNMANVEVGTSLQYTITVTGSNLQNVTGIPDGMGGELIEVADTLPLDTTGIMVGTPSAGTLDAAGYNAGDTLTWSIPKSALTANPQTLTIDLTASSDPCQGGNVLSNTASLSTMSSAGCTLNSASTATTLLGNSPATIMDLTFETGAPPGMAPPNGAYETGSPDAGVLGSREAGEGEFIPLEASYTFSAGYGGQWNGAVFEDDFSGSTDQVLVPGSAEINIDGGGFQAVPAVVNMNPGLSVDLSFVEAIVSDMSMGGHDFQIRYQTTVADAALTGSSRTLLQRSTLRVPAGGGEGSCAATGNEYVQGVYIPIERADASISVNIPTTMAVCEEFDAVITVDNQTAFNAENVVVRVQTSGSYDYVAGLSTFGGVFSGNMTVDEMGADPVFSLTPQELTGSGTITVRMRRRAGTQGMSGALTVELDYDDHESEPDSMTVFAETANDSPILETLGELTTILSPQTFTVLGDEAQWTVYVTNTGNGPAFEPVLRDVLPAFFTPDAATTNSENGGAPLVNVSGQTMSFELGSIPMGSTQRQLLPGETAAITVAATLNGTSCNFVADLNTVEVEWGCDGAIQTTSSVNEPSFQAPAGMLQSVHDLSNSLITLCGAGSITVIVRNTGIPSVFDVTIDEFLDPSNTGIDYVSGTAEYSTDAMSWTPAEDEPTFAGGTYSWDSSDIAALAEIAPTTSGTGTVYLRFDVTSDDTTNNPALTVLASANAELGCGASVPSPGTPVSIPTQTPDITVTLDGQNSTNGDPGFSNTVYGAPGDSVIWRIQIANSGAAPAQNVRLSSLLPDSDLGAVETGNITGPIGAPTINQAYSSGDVISIDDIPAGMTVEYQITETVGPDCQSVAGSATVTWGCNDLGATVNSALSMPTDNNDDVNLDLIPSFASSGISQSLTRLPGGRTEVRLNIDNQGGTASTLFVTNTLPAGQELDTSFTTTFSGPTGMMMVQGGSTTVPTFDLSHELENGEVAQITYRIKQSGNFDTTALPAVQPETNGNGDPSLPPTGDNVVVLDFESACGAMLQETANLNLNPRTPDLDVVVSPVAQPVRTGQNYTFTFTITNNGDNNSTADQIDFDVVLGTGFNLVSATIVTAGDGGMNGATCPSGVCALSDLGTLDKNDSIVIEVVVQALNNGNPLTLLGTVEGSMGDGSGNDYSLDSSQATGIGFEFDKVLAGTSEPWNDATPGEVAIGEDLTFRLTGRWFGGSPVTGISLRDTLPSNLGYVSHSTTGSNNVTFSVTGDTPVLSGDFDISVNDIASGTGVFEIDLVARVLNLAAPGSDDGVSFTNSFDAAFTAAGLSFATDSPPAGFPAGSEADLHDELSFTIRRPDFTNLIEVRNVTASGSFGANADGEAGDVLEYRVTLTNTGNAPAFDLSLLGSMPSADLILIDGSSDGLDNDGDGTSDPGDGQEGEFNAGAGTVTFDETETGSSAVGTSFAQLDPTEMLVLLFRTTAGSGLNPEEVVTILSDLTATTLPGPDGGQATQLGNGGTQTGEDIITLNDSATFTVEAIGLLKELVTTSLGADTSTTVRVGEQVRYRLSVTLPAGEAPSLVIEDQLPTGMLLIETPAVVFGASVPSSQPTISSSGSPTLVEWDFGNRMVVPGSAADRTITIEYITQVENIAGNVDSVNLSNSATSTFGMTTSAPTSVIVSIAEATVTSSLVVSPTSDVDAGDTLVYTATFMNTSSVDAFDLTLVADLPVDLTYVTSSVSVVPVDPGFPEPDIVGNQLIWGRLQAAPYDVDLAAGQSIQLQFSVTVDDTAEPNVQLTTSVDAQWTSLDGEPALSGVLGTSGDSDGERIGSGVGPNLLTVGSQVANDVTNIYTVTAVASGEAANPPNDAFRVGDLVTFTLTVDLQEGTADNFLIEDTLPPGLEFHDFQPIDPGVGNTTISFTAPMTGSGTAPAEDDVGTLTWNLGTVVNAGDGNAANDTLTLTYRARVLNTGGVPVAPGPTTVSNSALLRWDDGSGANQASGSSGDSIDIKQPVLTNTKSLASGQATSVTAGDTVDFVLEVQNTGQAPAYNIQLSDTLPAGMRMTTPTVTASTLNGSGVTLGAPTFVGGVLTFTLSDTEVIDPGGSLRLEIRGQVDSDIGAGRSLQNSAQVTQYFSLPSGQPETDAGDIRQYAALTPASVVVMTPMPMGIAKSADVGTSNVGETVTYTLTVPSAPVSVVLYDVAIRDTLPTGTELRSVSFTDFGGGNSGNDTSNLTDLILDYDSIPPGAQAIVTLEAVVLDIPGNVSGTDLDNQASFTWAREDGQAPLDPALQSSIQTTTVTDPALTITKTKVSESVADPMVGLQAGDSVTYNIVVQNPGDGDAHDVVIRDISDENLDFLSTTPANDPGMPVESPAMGGNIVWTWDLAAPIAAGGNYSFDVTFELGPMVQAMESLANTAEVDWTTTAGANADERSDTEANLNPVTVTTGSASLTKSILSPADTAFTIGEEITYRMTFDFGQGEVLDVRLQDNLPDGLSFRSASVTASDVLQTNDSAVAVLSGPTGDLGGPVNLDFELGDLKTTGANPELHLDVVVFVEDEPGVSTLGAMLTNSALVQLDDPQNPGTPVMVPATQNVSITVEEPVLLMGLDAAPSVGIVDAVEFTARIENTGTTAAYQPNLVFQIPADFRDVDPTTLPFQLTISGGRELTLVQGTDYGVTWDAMTGTLSFDLNSAAGFIDTTETLTVEFQSELNDVSVDGAALNVTGTVTDFSTLDESAGAAPDARNYPVVAGSATSGTPNGAQGDDAGDDVALNVVRPEISMSKGVDLLMAMPGDTLHYTLVLQNTGSADADDCTFSDNLSPAFEPGSITNVTESSGTGSVSISPSALMITDLDLPTGSMVTIEFDATLRSVLPDMSVLMNQGSLQVVGMTNSVVSDSTNPADGSNPITEGGNDSGDPNDDDPTETSIGSMTSLIVEKTVSDDNGTPLEPDDVLTYAIEIRNEGDENAINAVLQDSIPGGTSYVPGSTRLNGAVVPDIGQNSELVSGLTVQSPGMPSGEIHVGAPALVSFQVTVSSEANPGSLISNRAFLDAEGEGSGVVSTVPSDDPTSGADGDPTNIVVGDAPLLDLAKEAVDLNGGDLDPLDELAFSLTLSNYGTQAAEDVVIEDLLPANVDYVPSSMLLDPDGSGGAVMIAVTDAADSDAADYDQTLSGAVTLAIGNVPANSEVVLMFRVTVDAGALPGDVVSNQAVVRASGLPDELSDADANDSNGDQPTVLVVGSSPLLSQTKRVLDGNGGAVLPGESLIYEIVTRNDGTAPATDLTIFDPVPPAGTSYVAGSTQINGMLVSDIGPDSPLVGGLSAGTLAPGESVRVQFQVLVDSGLAQGTVISNQSNYTSTIGGSGLSDSGLDDGVETGNSSSNPNDDDPTQVTVGGMPGTAGVSGITWIDSDRNGSYDTNEPLLEGWVIELVLDGVLVSTTRTDSLGSYSFSGFPPGTGYEVRFRHPVSNATYGFIDGLSLVDGSLVLDQSLPIDPSGVIYDSVTRIPVPGALVNLRGPGGSNVDAFLLPGQPNQLTGADGFYRFDLIPGAPAQVYTIEITPPSDFLPNVPSVIIPPEAFPFDPTGGPDPTEIQSQLSAPTGMQDTTYYLEFDLAPGDPNVVNNHIPLDPVLNDAIVIQKTTGKATASIGDLIPYRVSIRNTSPIDFTMLEINDIVPPGFKFISESARLIDPAAATETPAPPVQAGRMLTWSPIAVSAGQEVILEYILVVGAGVDMGEYTNQAFVFDPGTGQPVSPIATVTVGVIPDSLLDCAEIIGQVFEDRNANGYQDKGEPGIPGVRLATARGLLIVTDEFGRYHITCADVPHATRGSNFILKIDERTMPSGYRMTTENPRIVRLTRGKVTKANFGASIHRVVRADVTAQAFDEENSLTKNARESLSTLLDELRKSPSVLRVTYTSFSTNEPASERVKSFISAVNESWGSSDPDLQVEKVFQSLLPADLPDPNTGAFSNSPKSTPNQSTAPLEPDWRDEPSGKVDHDGDVRIDTAPPNTESNMHSALHNDPRSESGIRISVDGHGADSSISEGGANAQRLSDVRLHDLNMRMRLDGLAVEPSLNVTAWPDSAKRGEAVSFRSYSNYWAFIDGAELRIFGRNQSVMGKPDHVIPLSRYGIADWTPNTSNPDEVQYVLRVYDRDGRYDETTPKPLSIVHDDRPLGDETERTRELLAGYGENHVAIRNIPVSGGAISVDGTEAREGFSVWFGGQAIPIDDSGRYIARQIIPHGHHNVSITIVDPTGAAYEVTREVYIPTEDWFFVGLADLTVGKINTNGAVQTVTQSDEFDDEVFVNGRLAFYLKGKVKGEWLLTASLDTREESLDNILENLDERDPRSLLRRLDPDRFYPVYGDDSTLTQDAPTQGRFYVRLEKGNSKILWGNFTTRLTETDLAQVDRGLYGAQVHWEGEDLTTFGAPKTEVDLFAASPETVAAREEFRGTGGSLYYLQRRDLTIGSERIRVEVRDKDSGLVLSTQTLAPLSDYDIDYVQGRILLTEPLASTAEDNLLVQDASLGGHHVFLVVRYEYRPGFDGLDDLAVGGRATRWISDSLQVGVTGSRQEQVGGDQDLLGVDATYRVSERSYLKVEFAKTEGPGNGAQSSLDGGFVFGGVPQNTSSAVDASAFRVEGKFDHSDLRRGGLKGMTSFYFQSREDGFSAPGQLTLGDTTQWGANIELPFDDRTRLRTKIDDRKISGGLSNTAFEVDLHRRLDDEWDLGLGVRHEDLDPSTPVAGAQSGSRSDAAARLTFVPGSDDWTAYTFVQGTLDADSGRRDNDRIGAGGELRLNDRWKLGGEVSGGDGGLGSSVTTDWRKNDRTDLYLAYRLDADRTDTAVVGSRNGTLTTGMRTRYTDHLSVFSEERLSHGAQSSGIVHSHGVDYAPSDKWTCGVKAESGTLEANGATPLERTAVSLSGGFREEDGVLYGGAVEVRDEEQAGNDRTTLLLRNNVSLQVSDDWRLVAKFDLSRSEASQGSFFDGDFTEGSLGFAYRPTESDRWNALVRYAYIEDVPSPGQVDLSGLALDFSQKSHVLSADVSCDVMPWLTLGGKYGLRYGEMRANKASGPWFDSAAQLGVLRADLHVVHDWDAHVEGRVLDVEAASDRRTGLLVALYRHLGQHARLGVGYNFADFSDDLTNLNYDYDGVFVNLTGKF